MGSQERTDSTYDRPLLVVGEVGACLIHLSWQMRLHGIWALDHSSRLETMCPCQDLGVQPLFSPS